MEHAEREGSRWYSSEPSSIIHRRNLEGGQETEYGMARGGGASCFFISFNIISIKTEPQPCLSVPLITEVFSQQSKQNQTKLPELICNVLRHCRQVPMKPLKHYLCNLPAVKKLAPGYSRNLQQAKEDSKNGNIEKTATIRFNSKGNIENTIAI